LANRGGKDGESRHQSTLIVKPPTEPSPRHELTASGLKRNVKESTNAKEKIPRTAKCQNSEIAAPILLGEKREYSQQRKPLPRQRKGVNTSGRFCGEEGEQCHAALGLAGKRAEEFNEERKALDVQKTTNEGVS